MCYSHSRAIPPLRSEHQWHINADEPRALDYNDYNQPGLYNPDAYRSSDHDPAIIGLSLGREEEQWVYLPVIVNAYPPRSWYQYDLGEPNDTPEQAYGPLAPGQTYQAYIWDETDLSDWYHFTPSTNTAGQVSLTNITEGSDLDLYVYYLDDGRYYLVARSNSTETGEVSVNFAPSPDRKYYVVVSPFKGRRASYHLTATYW